MRDSGFQYLIPSEWSIMCAVAFGEGRAHSLSPFLEMNDRVAEAMFDEDVINRHLGFRTRSTVVAYSHPYTQLCIYKVHGHNQR